MVTIREREVARHLVGRAIHEARTAKELSQSELADRLQVQTKTIQNWEQGRREPDAASLVHLADVLEVPINAFLATLSVKTLASTSIKKRPRVRPDRQAQDQPQA